MNETCECAKVQYYYRYEPNHLITPKEETILNKPVIVCVDDEPIILYSLKVELKKILGKKYVIENAESGKDALEIIEDLLEEDIDIPLVISDYIMPHMKGDELLQRIHAIATTTLKVMLTGQASIEAVANTINRAKLYRYMGKPWDHEDLKLTVTEAIRRYFQDKQLAEQNAKLQQMNLQLEQSNRDQAALINAYERFVPRQFLSLLDKKSILDINLGDQIEKEMSILFTDIRGFTSISETLTLQDNFEFINSYLGQMQPIIKAHHGFIDKFIGDAIMALFPTSADDAICAGIAMLKRLTKYNQLLQTAGFEPLNIGIGINTGPLMLGVLGGQDRMEGTVIADAVNVAARVESLTKTYDTALIITENTYQKLEASQYLMRVIDRVTVKGKTQPVTVYEVFDAQSPALIELKSTTLPDFEQGFKCFHNEQFEEAQGFFEKVLQVNNNDNVAQVYSEHCRKVLNMTMPERPKIMMVDDTPSNLKILSVFLRTNNFEVLVAENGKMALEIVELNSPHLILLDVMMPEIDGFETCKRLKANPKTQDIPVIFMTALSDTMDKVKGFGLGAVDYITKPFQREEVLSRIKTHLSIHHLQQQVQAKNVELEIHNVELKERIKTLTTQTKFF
jgi:DNA-binding response OmpR family regulator/class 3 adenylate cyclase